MIQTSIDVANALLQIGAVRFTPTEPVRFKSGILSPIYVDNRTLPYWPSYWTVIIEGFRTLIGDDRVTYDILAGMETAGIPHSAALGYSLQRPSIFVRKAAKEHGLKRRVEGGPVEGKRVLLIEDLVTTGGSSLSGVEALRDEGAIVEDCCAIASYDLDEALGAFDTAKVRLHTLTSFPVILQQAAERGDIDDGSRGLVEDWLRDPRGWNPPTGLG
jgi:orotate phosphoribosyltransferase